MNNNNIKNQEEEYGCNPDKPSTIAFDYSFNYFGGDSFKEKVITGVSVSVAVRVYKNGEELKFMKEPTINDELFLCDAFSVSFDREKLYIIEKNVSIETLFRIEFGWDEIKAEVVGFSMDYESSFTEEELKDMPEIMKKLPVSAPMDVTEEEFREFLSNHKDDFDIKDNIKAQVPSFSFI